MNEFGLVGIGGAAGAVARYLVGTAIEGDGRDTFVVNVVGSFALGALVATPADGAVALAVGTGFCGAFTTFSSFAVDTVRLAEDGRERAAVANAAGTLAAALLSVAVGGAVGRLLASLPV